MYTPEIPMHTLDDIRATLLVPNQYIRWYVHAANTLIYSSHSRSVLSFANGMSGGFVLFAHEVARNTNTQKHTNPEQTHHTHYTHTQRHMLHTMVH